jgi:HK97 family phage major capsid protein
MEIKEWVESVEAKLKEHGVDSGLTLELKGRMDEMEQKIARRGSRDDVRANSIGEQVAAAEQFKAFAGDNLRPNTGVQVEVKAITTASNSAGAAASQPYRDTIVGIPKRRMAVRDLLNVVGITSGSVEIPRQTARTSNAGMVAEGTMKPESSYAWEMANVPIRKIAHWVHASSEILADAPQLAGIIDTELLYGLDYVEDVQLLKGDGTGQNLTGMLPLATDYATPTGITGFATPTMIDKVALAMLQCSLANFTPDGVVVHPSDWLMMRLAKDAEGNYILGAPGANVEPRLFGVPVVPTQGMTPGEFLTGEFGVAATIYDRMTKNVLVSTEDGDNFRLNLITILAEQRLGLAVKQPLALVNGPFANA